MSNVVKLNTIDPLSNLKLAILTAVLTQLKNINTTFANIQANPSIANVTAQLAALQGQQLTLALELPALIPTLEGDAIASGAQLAQQGFNNLITNIESQIASLNPPITPPPPTAGEEKASA